MDKKVKTKIGTETCKDCGPKVTKKGNPAGVGKKKVVKRLAKGSMHHATKSAPMWKPFGI